MRQAIRISADLRDTGLRYQALHSLVDIATLLDRAPEGGEASPRRSFSPLERRGSAVLRGVPRGTHSAPSGAQQHAIVLRSGTGRGVISQQDDALMLELHGPEKRWQGQSLNIAVPLGSLVEAIRWIGGNPTLISRPRQIDRRGFLKTTLGHTALRLSDQVGRNTLEAIFSVLEVWIAE